MSEQENELEKALAKNGGFDAEKAKRLGLDLVPWFDASLKRAARKTWLVKIVGAVVFEFAFIGFCYSFGMKSLIGYATLLVVVFIAAGIWAVGHAITNTKISLLERDEAHAVGASWATHQRHCFHGSQIGRYRHIRMVAAFQKGKRGMVPRRTAGCRDQRSRSDSTFVAWRNVDRRDSSDIDR